MTASLGLVTLSNFELMLVANSTPQILALLGFAKGDTSTKGTNQ
jgi:hypothetical protein